jgi:hypothetical protein
MRQVCLKSENFEKLLSLALQNCSNATKPIQPVYTRKPNKPNKPTKPTISTHSLIRPNIFISNSIPIYPTPTPIDSKFFDFLKPYLKSNINYINYIYNNFPSIILDCNSDFSLFGNCLLYSYSIFHL